MDASSDSSEFELDSEDQMNLIIKKISTLNDFDTCFIDNDEMFNYVYNLQN